MAHAVMAAELNKPPASAAVSAGAARASASILRRSQVNSRAATSRVVLHLEPGPIFRAGPKVGAKRRAISWLIQNRAHIWSGVGVFIARGLSDRRDELSNVQPLVFLATRPTGIASIDIASIDIAYAKHRAREPRASRVIMGPRGALVVPLVRVSAQTYDLPPSISHS